MSDGSIIVASTLNEALRAIAKRNVVVVGGGTDVLVKLHDVIDRPWPRLLILENIKTFHRISLRNGRVVLGPLATFAEIAGSPLVRRHAPQLAEAASKAGSVLIRNRGTIGGNIANASPAGDMIPPLFVLSGRIELSSTRGKRYVTAEEFFKGPGFTVLKPSELVTSVSLAKTGGRGFYLRLAARRALAISKVSVAADVSLERKKVKKIRIALGAVAPTVVRSFRAEEYLTGKELTEDSITEACYIAKNEAKPITDIRSDSDYRREMVAVLVRRGLSRIAHE